MMILIFCNFGLPDSCANATRSFNIATIIQKLGYEVELLGVATQQKDLMFGTYKGIQYRMIKSSSESGIRSWVRVLKNKNVIENEIKAICREKKIDAIIISNVYAEYSGIFLRLSKVDNIPIIVNQVEWYDKSNEIFHGPFGILKLIGNRIALKYYHVKMGNIIAISELLGAYYTKRKCNVIVIPSIVDPFDYQDINPYRIRDDTKLIVSYAGSPATKDYIKNAVDSLLYMNEMERDSIELHLYGCTKKQLISLGVSEKDMITLDGVLFCHGRIPYVEVKEHISESDFTILLRPKARYANAGFPTKVSESMICGTPVIANITSDLGKYLIDECTGIICDDESPESCKSALLRAKKLSKKERMSMRKKTMDMAVEYLVIDNYLHSMSSFLDDAVRDVD